MQILSSGQEVQSPKYDFTQNERRNDSTKIKPKDVVILEGIFSLYDPVIRDLLSLKCFLDVPCDIRFIRRLERDVKERGRDLNSIISQYYDTVRPMYLKYLEPQKVYADLVIGSETDIACDVITARIQQVSKFNKNNNEQRSIPPL